MSALAGRQSLDASDGDNKDENNEVLYATTTLREGDVKWLVDCGATQERAIALLSQHGSLLAAIQAVLNATPNEASDDLALAAAVAGSFPTDIRRMVRQLGSSLKGQAEKAAVGLATLARDKPGSRRAIARAQSNRGSRLFTKGLAVNAANGDASLSAKMKGPGLLRS